MTCRGQLPRPLESPGAHKPKRAQTATAEPVAVAARPAAREPKHKRGETATTRPVAANPTHRPPSNTVSFTEPPSASRPQSSTTSTPSQPTLRTATTSQPLASLPARHETYFTLRQYTSNAGTSRTRPGASRRAPRAPKHSGASCSHRRHAATIPHHPTGRDAWQPSATTCLNSAYPQTGDLAASTSTMTTDTPGAFATNITRKAH